MSAHRRTASFFAWVTCSNLMESLATLEGQVNPQGPISQSSLSYRVESLVRRVTRSRHWSHRHRRKCWVLSTTSSRVWTYCSREKFKLQNRLPNQLHLLLMTRTWISQTIRCDQLWGIRLFCFTFSKRSRGYRMRWTRSELVELCVYSCKMVRFEMVDQLEDQTVAV